MSVTQAMEWLIEHIDDPMIDEPLPGRDTPGATAAAEAPGLSTTTLRAQACLPYQSSTEVARHDELTEIFQRIRRKREFRPDSRVSVNGCQTNIILFYKTIFNIVAAMKGPMHHYATFHDVS